MQNHQPCAVKDDGKSSWDIGRFIQVIIHVSAKSSFHSPSKKMTVKYWKSFFIFFIFF